MNYIKHIFFDLDHTLWDFETNSNLAFKKIFTKHGLAVDLEKFFNYYSAINRNYWKLFRQEKIGKETLRYGRLKDTFELIKFEAGNDLINKLSQDYIEFLPHNNHLIEVTNELLKYLYPKYKMHIITNGFTEVQHRKLINSGIKSYFDEIITSERVGFKKPNPKIFKYALELIGSTPDQAIMIGDNWEADIMGAKKLGIDVIYCNFNKEPVSDSIKSISNLLALKQYF